MLETIITLNLYGIFALAGLVCVDLVGGAGDVVDLGLLKACFKYVFPILNLLILITYIIKAV